MNEIKEAYETGKRERPNSILIFRIGDFYETFYDDARTLKPILGLVLTNRKDGQESIPMLGFPAHSAEKYIADILRSGLVVKVFERTGGEK